MNHVYQDARDFAGADWENMKPESRGILLKVYRIDPVYKRLRWGLLPPTIKEAITKTVMKKVKR
jgi:putative SOS response-associated peptidase YedK